jgi:uncharacterized RDD family membrane protein YckC
MTETASEDWYVARNGQQQGPMPRAQVQAMIDRGEVGGQDLAWREGMGQWLPLGSLSIFTTTPAAGLTALGDATAQLNYYTNTVHEPIYVGFWWRVLAYIIDYCVLLIPSGIVGFVFGLIAAAGAGNSQQTRIVINLGGNLLGIIVGWLYSVLMESSPKQATLGKMAIGVIVIDAQGDRLTFGRATGRYFGKIVSGLILCIGFMMVGWTARKQGLHDIMAGTYVIKK